MRTLIFSLLFTCVIRAQFIDPYEYFIFEYSDNVINYFPAGSLGFGNSVNVYNPSFINSNESFFAEISAVSNINQSIKENDLPVFRTNLRLYPNIAVQYQGGWYAIQLSYVNKVLSALKNDDREWSFNFYPTVVTSSLTIPFRQSALQLSGLFRLNKNLDVNIGVITNSAETKFDMGNAGYVKYYRNLFDNIQVTGGLNYNCNEVIKGYLKMVSAASQNEFEIERSVNQVKSPSLDHPEYYFTGLVGAGVQVSAFEQFRFSLEAAGDYYTFWSSSPYYKVPRSYYNPYYGLQEYTVFNNRAAAGISYKPADNIDISFLYSKYLSYRNVFTGGTEGKDETKPYYINAGLTYNFLNYYIKAGYQFSGYGFRNTFPGDTFNGRGKHSETNHYMGLAFGIKL